MSEGGGGRGGRGEGEEGGERERREGRGRGGRGERVVKFASTGLPTAGSHLYTPLFPLSSRRHTTQFWLTLRT